MKQIDRNKNLLGGSTHPKRYWQLFAKGSYKGVPFLLFNNPLTFVILKKLFIGFTQFVEHIILPYALKIQKSRSGNNEPRKFLTDTGQKNFVQWITLPMLKLQTHTISPQKFSESPLNNLAGSEAYKHCISNFCIKCKIYKMSFFSQPSLSTQAEDKANLTFFTFLVFYHPPVLLPKQEKSSS